MAEKPNAIGQRREDVAALPRPAKLDTGTSIKEEVAQVHETADLHRVYVKDWQTVYTSDTRGEPGIAEAKARFAEQYEGRVTKEDWTVYSHGPDHSANLRLRLWTMRGEFKHELDANHEAMELEGELDTEVVVVLRNSASDFKLREYGVKKLTA